MSKPRRISYVGNGKERKMIQTILPSRIDEILQNKGKDPETIEELTRQLEYLEKSITKMKVTTVRNHTQALLNINQRRLENTKLIKTLEVTKSNKKLLQRKLN